MSEQRENSGVEGFFPIPYQKRPLTVLLVLMLGAVTFAAAKITKGQYIWAIVAFAIVMVLLSFVVSVGETSAFGSLFKPRDMGESTELRTELSWLPTEEE